jgi:bacterioferritin-associated ferredoxin
LESKKQILENLRKVCLCRSIKAGTIMTAIRGGTLTFEALRRELGVGTGNCKAKRCRPKIEQRICDHKAGLKNADEIKVPSDHSQPENF